MNTEQSLTPLEQRLASLVAQPTITADTDLNTEVLDGIKAELTDLGMQTKLVITNSVPTLIASFSEFDQTPLWLAAHIDVVPDDTSNFTLRADDEKLYGRGVYDMKYAVAIYLQLVDELAEQKPNLGIIITADEELGGQNGSGILQDYINLQDTTVLLPDGGGPWKLERKAKGGLWMRLTATGKAAHASRPYLGSSAITALVSAIHDLETGLPHKDGSTYDDLTFIIGTIQGGSAMNQLAESAQATIDIRFGNSHSLQEIQELVANILVQHPAVMGEEILARPAHNNNLDHPDTQLLCTIFAKILGRELEVVDSNGATDAQFIAAAGAHTIVLYPDGGGHHGGDEFITRKALAQFYAGLKEFVAQKLQ